MMTNATFSEVIAGLDPAIHDASPRNQALFGLPMCSLIMDARVKPAHDAVKRG
jgi:hypothetical protein